MKGAPAVATSIMRTPSLRHLTDESLLRDLTALVANDRTTTAALVAHVSEVNARGLFRPLGYSSMFQYCIRELGMSEDVAWRRIITARLARGVPRIFPALAGSRLHVSGVALLKNSDPNSQNLPAPVRVNVTMPEQLAAPAGPPAARPKLTPLSPERFALQVTIDRETYDALCHAQELIDHPADIAEVIKRALGLLVTQLEKRKFAATSKPRPANGRSSANPRHIPAHVRRAVRQRDQDQCTFESESDSDALSASPCSTTIFGKRLVEAKRR